ncbi:MAG: site-specific DNA-methyltransferase [Bacteroidales bacterium]|nr:site-specific DNA-methyltransferase [Bacteroidales bacterium]
MDKSELIAKLQQLEGLTDEEKSNLIGLLRQHKKYGLVWEDKQEDVEERLREQLPVLTEVKERRIISGAPDAPNHILIEGDNLEALTALSYTHEGKIDVIYIDPPYNTGNKDFVYNDAYVDTEDAYRHSKWLSFMNKRLRIAKRLLSDKGVIFISIDDNEQANLKLLCDEVFGERNFVDIFSWNKTETPANLALKTKKAIEYIVCYTKHTSPTKFRGLNKTSTSNNGLMNQTNSVHVLVFPANKVDTKLANGIYSKGKYGTSSYDIELLEDTEVKDGFFIRPITLRGKFKWGQENLDKEISKGTQISIKTIAFSPSYEKKEYEPEVPWNLINKSFGVDTNEIAGAQLVEIMGETVFSFPKPVSLVKYLINFIEADNILDFFAGSGTTLHATMQLNAEDGGHRKCILVTNNENQICEQVTYERNRRVIQGYISSKGQKVEGLHSNNLRYYRTDFIPRERTQRNMRALVNAATDLLCVKEDLYEEKLMLGTLKLKPQLARYFSDNQKHMLVVYREEVVNELVKAIQPLELGKTKLKIYIFSPGRYAFDDDFYEVQDKVQLVALPAAIYDAYQRVLPKQKERLLDEVADKTESQPVASELSFNFEEGGEQ